MVIEEENNCHCRCQMGTREWAQRFCKLIIKAMSEYAASFQPQQLAVKRREKEYPASL